MIRWKTFHEGEGEQSKFDSLGKISRSLNLVFPTALNEALNSSDQTKRTRCMMVELDFETIGKNISDKRSLRTLGL